MNGIGYLRHDLKKTYGLSI